MKYFIDTSCLKCKKPMTVEVIKNNYSEHKCNACGFVFFSESNEYSVSFYKEDFELIKIIDDKRACCSG